MRGAFVEGLVGRSAGALVGATLALAAGCKSGFTGPYMCAEGYASCVNPSSQNTCETDTTTDGLNCGGCGTVCPVGAPCLDSSCGPAAVRIAQTGSSALVKTNATTVFWSGNNQSNVVYRLPLSAAAGTAGTVLVSDGASLNTGRTTFVVDDANVYYFAAIPGGGSGCPAGQCFDLVQQPLTGGTPTVLMAWSALSTLLANAGIQVANGGANPGASLAVSGPNVYFLLSLMSNNTASYAIGDAMIGGAGQVGQIVGKMTSYNSPTSTDLVANTTMVAFETWDNGATWLHVFPVGGGSMRTLPLPISFTGPIAADESYIYAIASGCQCNDNQLAMGPPPGAVTRVPLDGGASKTLARFWGTTGGAAVDSTNVYWSTDTTAWKVPLAGGTPTPVAGNLGNGVAAYQCNGCGGGSQPGPTGIAVAPSAVYVAASGTEQAILKVAR